MRSDASSKPQGPGFYPELMFMSVQSFACSPHIHADFILVHWFQPTSQISTYIFLGPEFLSQALDPLQP